MASLREFTMEILEKLRSEIESTPVLLYMKGDPNEPQCGFSARAVHVLSQLGVSYETRDVLANPDVRANLHKVSNWPTFPQLFIHGELIGGSDIILELFESGELQAKLAEK